MCGGNPHLPHPWNQGDSPWCVIWEVGDTLGKGLQGTLALGAVLTPSSLSEAPSCPSLSPHPGSFLNTAWVETHQSHPLQIPRQTLPFLKGGQFHSLLPPLFARGFSQVWWSALLLLFFMHFKNLFHELPWWLSGKESSCNPGDAGSIPGLGRSPREGNGNPL